MKFFYSFSLSVMIICFLCFLTGCETFPQSNSNPRKYITIGTGSVSGVYYPAGLKIADIINNNSENSIKATAKTSYNASKYNIIDVSNGDLSLGIAQSNDLFSHYKNAPNGKKLRSLFTLHTEILTVLSRQDNGVGKILDLKGKTVRLSTTAVVDEDIKEVIEAEGLNLSDIKQVQAKSVLCPNLIQKAEIDAYFFMVGHPNKNTENALNGNHQVTILPLSDQAINKLLGKHPYYIKSEIPMSYYKIGTGKVDSIGVKSVFFASEDTDAETIYKITKYVFSNLEKLKNSNLALGSLNVKDMVPVIRPPIHDGALKYYKEVGLK